MALMMENLGLGAIGGDREMMNSFADRLIAQGKPVFGYTGMPYLYLRYGDTEFWGQTTADGGELALIDIDSHCTGTCIWNLECSGFDVTPLQLRPMRRLLLMRSPGQQRVVPVQLINADILPCLSEGTAVSLQMAAMPVKIRYYADGADCEAYGEEAALSDGTLYPLGFLLNHENGRTGAADTGLSDSVVLFRGTVKDLSWGRFEADGRGMDSFLRCRIQTELGPLDIIHALEQVPPEMRRNLRPGATVSGRCVLQASAAVGEYACGAVKDRSCLTALIRDALSHGEPERLCGAVAENAVLEVTAPPREPLTGREAVIRFLSTGSVRLSTADKCAQTAEGERSLLFSDESGISRRFSFELDDGGLIAKIRLG